MRSTKSFLSLFSVAFLLLVSCRPGEDASQQAPFLRLINLGKAHLENKESAKAIAAFEDALALQPGSPEAARNLARGHLLARQSDTALAILEGIGPEPAGAVGVATHFLRGVAHVRESRFAEALPELQAAARLDPHTPALRFQLALVYQALKKHAEAEQQLLATVELDPFHTGAYYRLASYARRAGQSVAYAAHQGELQRLRLRFGAENRSAEEWETCIYTLAEVPRPVEEKRGEVIPVRFTLPESGPGGAHAALGQAVVVALLEMDREGGYTLFLAMADGSLSLLTPGQDGGGELRLLDLKLPDSPVLAAAPLALAANFHDPAPTDRRFDPALDTWVDILLLSPAGAHLLRRVDATSFEDLSVSAGLAGLAGRRAVWVDMDHDGDTDLWVAGLSGPEMWRNKGDGTFENASAELGLEGQAPTDVFAANLDGGGAVDLLAAMGTSPSMIYHGKGAGEFTTMSGPPGPWPSAHGILAEDLDDDGLADLIFLGEDHLLIVPAAGGDRPELLFASFTGQAMALIDYDNDGRVDLALAGGAGDAGAEEGGIRLWRNAGQGLWPEVSGDTGLALLTLPQAHQLLALDVDADGDSDLIAIAAGGSQVLLNQGGHLGGQLKVSLLGSKSNPSGLGASLVARRAGFQARRTVNASVTEIGLGGAAGLDTLQTTWTNGIVDNLLDVPTAGPVIVVEKNVASGSCPYLYAWDGQEFRFVTDLLGNSPLGLSIRRGEVLPADPDELVWIGPEESLAQRQGNYVLQVTEELREVLYLDEAHLVAVDHDPGVEIHSTDRLGPEPFPPSELWAMAAPRTPRLAIGDDGLDRKAALEAIDGRYSPPGEPLPPPMRGMAHSLALTLDFGPLDSLRNPMLALTGWLQYGDASTNIALSQSSSWKIIPPTLEVEDAAGHWRTLDLVLGMPAGKTKTIVADLTGLLPPGAGRLRLTTSFELRWDRIALGERLGADAMVQHLLAPAGAELSFRGFSEIRSRAPGHPTTPLYALASENPPWRTSPEGWVTRYGEILDLVLRRDQRLAILNGGDALELRFPSSTLPPVPAGKVRTFFFHSVGWDKDSDHNVLDGERVRPLPVALTADDDWWLRYNTRWVSRDRFRAR